MDLLLTAYELELFRHQLILTALCSGKWVPLESLLKTVFFHVLLLRAKPQTIRRGILTLHNPTDIDPTLLGSATEPLVMKELSLLWDQAKSQSRTIMTSLALGKTR